MKKGYTLVEAAIVILIIGLVLWPTYTILSHGTRSATKGVHRNRVIMLGQQILGQIKMDISASILAFDKTNNEPYNIQDVIDIDSNDDEDGDLLQTFIIYTFKGSPYQEKVLRSTAGPAIYKRINGSEYRYSPKKKTLEHRVITYPLVFGAGNDFKMLSNQVNHFAITTHEEKIYPDENLSQLRGFFIVALQLFDQDEKYPGDPFITESLAIINPRIFNTIIDYKINRNWHTDASKQN